MKWKRKREWRCCFIFYRIHSLCALVAHQPSQPLLCLCARDLYHTVWPVSGWGGQQEPTEYEHRGEEMAATAVASRVSVCLNTMFKSSNFTHKRPVPWLHDEEDVFVCVWCTHRVISLFFCLFLRSSLDPFVRVCVFNNTWLSNLDKDVWPYWCEQHTGIHSNKKGQLSLLREWWRMHELCTFGLEFGPLGQLYDNIIIFVKAENKLFTSHFLYFSLYFQKVLINCVKDECKMPHRSILKLKVTSSNSLFCPFFLNFLSHMT